MFTFRSSIHNRILRADGRLIHIPSSYWDRLNRSFVLCSVVEYIAITYPYIAFFIIFPLFTQGASSSEREVGGLCHWYVNLWSNFFFFFSKMRYQKWLSQMRSFAIPGLMSRYSLIWKLPIIYKRNFILSVQYLPTRIFFIYFYLISICAYKCLKRVKELAFIICKSTFLCLSVRVPAIMIIKESKVKSLPGKKISKSPKFALSAPDLDKVANFSSHLIEIVKNK